MEPEPEIRVEKAEGGWGGFYAIASITIPSKNHLMNSSVPISYGIGMDRAERSDTLLGGGLEWGCCRCIK